MEPIKNAVAADVVVEIPVIRFIGLLQPLCVVVN
jgi:hypothetical protein